VSNTAVVFVSPECIEAKVDKLVVEEVLVLEAKVEEAGAVALGLEVELW